ncbi:DUF2062 domain-containing protein [Hymenobacter armeniacus]|uniref:DUF2062 domain-containing protein n=1 Tax=Hymenobacter armeniacus TaxID=2771358 RepID=A0ABR8JWH1_9BACT|nr:DUF2062 domain-containing protein [Hymenobacter armeniacus]MBD2722264.1 DUF2062 domain-containing protein [Hymenobacter armeniacus]
MPLPETPSPPVAAPAAAPPHSWFRRKVIDPFVGLLKAGLSPEKLALTVALGVAFGLVPTFGVTTVVSAATALRLRLNVAAMQLAAHLMSAFQLALLIPMLRAGAILLGQGHRVAHLTVGGLRRLIDDEGWVAVGKLLWRAQLGALLLWALAAVPLVAVLYAVFRVVFRRVLARQSADVQPVAGG